MEPNAGPGHQTGTEGHDAPPGTEPTRPEPSLEVGPPKQWAAGIPGVLHSLKMSRDQMGVRRSLRTLPLVNQKRGFDCPGCAWPDPDGHRKPAEFCENGAKAVAEEATLARVGPEFFAQHSISELNTMSEHWLSQQGRLTHPVYREPGSDHYRQVTWHEAYDVLADHLGAMDSPDQAAFYTSGRASNEAAFCYQLFVRALGTNNLPDCSNMCHESSGTALTHTIGVGKGTVSLGDLALADLILVVGQNPGTNHPRMLTTLEEAKRGGASIVAINPLPEAGLLRFKNPQNVRGVVGRGTALADQLMQIRINGDLALFTALNHLLLRAEAQAPGTVLDHDFIRQHTEGFSEAAAHLEELDWPQVLAATGLTRTEIEELLARILASKNVVVCWAMGLTQHKNSVATIQEIVNLQLLRGNLGRPGAGVCPVRGHSNVQGDRTMGIWEKPTAAFLDAVQAEFGFEPPRAHGHDTVETIRAMRDGKIRVFMALGGNFVSATPDTDLTREAVQRCALTVQISTKLNRSHTITGEAALILPTLGRTELDVQPSGPQWVTVEDSMSEVHASHGSLPSASPELRSETRIICEVAERVLGERVAVPWSDFAADYHLIRERIERVVPGCAGYVEGVSRPGGYRLPDPFQGRRAFPTSSGLARFTVNPLEVVDVPEGHLLLQTLRSHDQYNTTIYGMDDRYRGIRGGRRVVFVSPADIEELGLADGQVVDLVTHWHDDRDRRAVGFRVVGYPTPRGCAAAYYPETNVLVPLDSVAEGSQTPTSKSVVVRLEPTVASPGEGAT